MRLGVGLAREWVGGGVGDYIRADQEDEPEDGEEEEAEELRRKTGKEDAHANVARLLGLGGGRAATDGLDEERDD